ncbi:MAG: prepilin-type N-terminal cleavage/methylation domain-containing protein [Spartobacteria bacterium]
MTPDPFLFFKKHARRLALWRGFANGFTILELLVAMSILAIIVVLMLGVLQSTSDAWRRNTDRTKAFASARAAFESMTRSISAATLNTYQDYYDANRSNRASGSLTFVPAVYGRRSDLHFITGTNLVNDQKGGAVFMTAPFDYESNNTNDYSSGQLNGIGYFVRFTTNSLAPAGATNSHRYRLMQFLQPTEELMVMNTNNAHYPNGWFTTPVNATPSTNIFPIADNVIAFAVLPQLSDRESATAILAPGFSYDTRMAWSNGAQPPNHHQLPPVVQVIMVVLDESSAKRIENGSTEPTNGLGFDPASVFTSPANLKTGLDTISSNLSAKRLNYRIFRSEIPIRAAKWTTN